MVLTRLYFDPDRSVIFPYDLWRRFSDERAPLCTVESQLAISRLGFPIGRHAMAAPPQLSTAWPVIEIPGGFRVDHASGKRLGYFYSWDDANAHGGGVCQAAGAIDTKKGEIPSSPASPAAGGQLNRLRVW
jgi:hypothetical protein